MNKEKKWDFIIRIIKNKKDYWRKYFRIKNILKLFCTLSNDSNIEN